MIPVDPNKLTFKGWPIGKPAGFNKQHEDLVSNIREVGQLTPVVITSSGAIIDGMHRVKAAIDLGIDVMCESSRDTRMFLESFRLSPVQEYLAL